MPLYEYKCDSCGYQFEIRQSFNDEPLTVCPNCGKATRRLIQPASIVFKGSGFYVNDHKGNNVAARNVKKDEGENGGAKTESADAKSTEKTTTEAPAATTKTDTSTPSAAPAAS